MGKYCHSLAELKSFKKMTNAEKIAQSVELTTSKNGQYQFLLTHLNINQARDLTLLAMVIKVVKLFKATFLGQLF